MVLSAYMTPSKKDKAPVSFSGWQHLIGAITHGSWENWAHLCYALEDDTCALVPGFSWVHPVCLFPWLTLIYISSSL